MAKKKSKSVGSCGIYVFVPREGTAYVLVHRRSRQISEPRQIAAPGGQVEKARCGSDGTDFRAGARATALCELREESGIQLDAHHELYELAAGNCHICPHINFCTILEQIPRVPGPEKAYANEVERGGMDGIGQPSGDGYHSWVLIEDNTGKSTIFTRVENNSNNNTSQHNNNNNNEQFTTILVVGQPTNHKNNDNNNNNNNNNQ